MTRRFFKGRNFYFSIEAVQIDFLVPFMPGGCFIASKIPIIALKFYFILDNSKIGDTVL